MEFLPVHHTQQFRTADSQMYAAIDLSIVQEKKPNVNELSNLPDLEITPVASPLTVSQVKNTYTAYDRGNSVETDYNWERIKKEQSDIQNLLHSLPILNSYFHLYNKIGEGTFSTVYLATLKSDPLSNKYAVKHLTQNYEQSRVQRELRCMNEIGGKDNVVSAIASIDNGGGCVTFIMPYLPHKRFNEYVMDMDVDETRLYMKNLLIALRRVHSFNVIHRDVKPANFLYNRETKQFLLVDFGLAQIVDPSKYEKFKEVDENAPVRENNKRKRTNSDEEATPVKRETKRIALKCRDNNVLAPTPVAKTTASYVSPQMSDDNTASAMPTLIAQELQSPVKPLLSKYCVEKTPLKTRMFSSSSCSSSSRKKLFYEESPPTPRSTELKSAHRKRASLGTSMMRAQLEMKIGSTPTDLSVKGRSFTPIGKRGGTLVQVKNSRVVRQHDLPSTAKSTDVFQKPSPVFTMTEACPCSGKGAICSVCSTRKKMVAPRAGTPGFRPPEVLFKYPHQTTAVDMWAAGVVMLCILSGCYPFFKSPNDLAGLAEMITMFGTEAISRIAARFGRRVVCNYNKKGVDLKKLCVRLRSRWKKKSGEKSTTTNTVKCEECLQSITEDGCLCPSETDGNGETYSSTDNDSSNGFPDSAYNLLSRLLDLDPSTRITAAEALDHPFLAGV